MSASACAVALKSSTEVPPQSGAGGHYRGQIDRHRELDTQTQSVYLTWPLERIMASCRTWTSV